MAHSRVAALARVSQPGPRPPSPPRQPSPPRGGGPIVLIVAIAVVAIVAVGGIGLVASQAGTQADRRPTATGRSPSPPHATVPSTAPSTTPPAPTSTPTATITADPTTPPATQPGTYKNDNYTVPAPNPNPPIGPYPTSWDQAQNYLKNSKLYSLQAPSPVRCQAGTLNPNADSQARSKQYYDAMTACLMRVWAPMIQNVGFTMHRPTVTMFSNSIQSKCGNITNTYNAFYCNIDGQITIGSNFQRVSTRYQSTRAVADWVIAHEFAHLVQDKVGIHRSGLYSIDKVGSETAYGRELNRRIELQADCLAGVFLNSVSQSHGVTQAERQQLTSLVGDFASKPGGTHGVSSSRSRWLSTGLSSTYPRACATFTVAASLVQ